MKREERGAESGAEPNRLRQSCRLLVQQGRRPITTGRLQRGEAGLLLFGALIARSRISGLAERQAAKRSHQLVSRRGVPLDRFQHATNHFLLSLYIGKCAD